MKHPLNSLFFQWSLELRFYRATEIVSVHLRNKVVDRLYKCWHLTRALSILGVPRQFTWSLAVWDGRWRGGESRRCSILLLHLWRRGGRLSQPGSTQQEDPQPEHLFSQQLLRVQVGVEHIDIYSIYIYIYGRTLHPHLERWQASYCVWSWRAHELHDNY